MVTIAAWALVEDATGTRIIGLVQRPQGEERAPGSFDFADEVDGFVGYTHQGVRTRRSE
jgi:hypothetical protein